MDSQLIATRRNLLLLFTAIFLFDILITLFNLDISGALRLFLTLILMYFVIMGHSWARILYIILCIVASGFMLLIAWDRAAYNHWETTVSASYGILLLVAAAYLWFSPAVSRYFDYQQNSIY